MSAFDGLLPEAAIVVEAGAADWEGGLLPEEQACLRRAVPARVREFTAGRNCARRALSGLGFAPAPILMGTDREPLFPAGVTGSITHTMEYCAAAVLRTGPVLSLGLDAEPHVPLEPGLLQLIADPAERRLLDELHTLRPQLCWDKLLFCIKEAFFKAWFPLGRQFIDFLDASVQIDPAGATFRIGLKRSDLEYFRDRAFSGAYAFRNGLALAALVLPANER